MYLHVICPYVHVYSLYVHFSLCYSMRKRPKDHMAPWQAEQFTSDSSISSSKFGKARKKAPDPSYKPGKNNRALKLCVKCRLTVRVKVCKVCKRPCHLECGRKDYPGKVDKILSPLGPPVTCIDCVATENEENAQTGPSSSIPQCSPRSYLSEMHPPQYPPQSDLSEMLSVSEIASDSTGDESIVSSATSMSSIVQELMELDEADDEAGLSRSLDELHTSQLIPDIHVDLTEMFSPQTAVLVDNAVTSSAVSTEIPDIAAAVPTNVMAASSSSNTRGRRALSPLSEVRSRVAQRRSMRLSSVAVVLAPPIDSDDSNDGDFEASDSETDSETEAARPIPVPVSRGTKKKAATQTDNPVWSSRDLPPEQAMRVDEIIATRLKPRHELPDVARMGPAEYFLLFFDQEVYDLIIEQSLLYRDQQKLKCGPLTQELLSKFLGFLLYAGCVPLPGKAYYWARGTRQQEVADNFTAADMKLVKAQLHFADNSLLNQSTLPGSRHDGFYKIESLIQMLNRKFQDVVVEEDCVAIDEQMTLYKGTKCPTGLKQYLPSKPISHGFKNWARGGTSGYIYEMTFYTGKQKTPVTLERRSSRTSTDGAEEPEPLTKLKTAQVVLKLTEKKPPGSYVYFDNLFASAELCRLLVERGLHFVCTFRGSRLKNCPLTPKKSFEKKERGAHEVFYHDVDKFAVCAWNDTKRVIVASDFVGAAPLEKAKRFNKTTKQYVEVDQPEMIRAYNTFMGGVDLADMLATMHTCPFRFRKWFLRVFERMIDTSLVNGWLLYRSRRAEGETYMTLFEFRRLASMALLKGHSPTRADTEVSTQTPEEEGFTVNRRTPKHVQAQDVPYEIRYTNNLHISIYDFETPNAVRCKLKGCGKCSFWKCETCRIFLCHDKKRNCHLIFHR
jgi:hypothetical protein